ncbi:hypothetical protein Bhyg_12870 [Pseudolycoriella hygida]|uniref:Transcription activator mbf2 n=1 Tax=Pseudolycoriella hygida TaxID=35572 RepID=A0A9Q0MXZ9_9DIPT|nr:hypothetical protein Bhyg_12870 [Pseudolycoriella hygida]
MCGKLNLWFFVAILFGIAASGSKLPDLTAWEDDGDDFEFDSLIVDDESDYWDTIQKQYQLYPLYGGDEDIRDEDDEKWNEIDNLDFVEDSVTEIVEPQPVEVEGSIRYTLGSRVHGDRVVGTRSQNIKYPRIMDVRANMTYPISGIGKNLTYVTIQVNQTSNIGRAYVAKGGIGKRFIAILVEAYKTFTFNYTATFYGK